ncbi:L-carnitine dehydratase/bile acid-inducible protein F [Caballeronia turbans]|jgi:formyl-CoA transferase|uniref:CaiB/BaiF CoA transferase family protein n=1 Tax=unclassified Caballeronia TaxID=2646786 RepID=UPI00074CDB2E|nr:MULTISPECIES: CoA transferase [unclassified Caballeronia]SAL16594.1 L-carnitine dehydratase/bile acid-inducible protein F [Caballeronia turbans]
MTDTKPAAAPGEGPLAGLRVIELAHIMSGPICGMMLADMGADVIKVEKIPNGDDCRRFAPMLPSGESASFLIVNRNKRGVALNLKTDGGKDVLRKMLASADVVTENYRRGTMEKLGMGYETLRAMNPGLIYCAISGYGRSGPMADKGGFDLIAQGMSGLMSMTGEPGQAPIKAGSPVTDINAGILAALGISAAYARKQTTGLGQMVDTSLFEAGLQQMYWAFANYFADGTVLPKAGSANPTSAPYQAFRTRDGWINIGAANQRNYERLVGVLNIPGLAEDERFQTNAGRLRHRELLVEILSTRLAERTTDEWLVTFDEIGLPSGAVLGVPEASSHEQAIARGMIVETEHPLAGPMRGIGLPIHFSEGSTKASRPAPLLGQHTTEVLNEYGFDDARIQALKDEGAILETEVPA